MRTVSSSAAMQRLALRWRSEGRRIGFVPTMGYLHAGHLSLIRRARRAVGPNGRVVVSIYVNPTQFAPTEDLSKYPRDLEGDLRQCRATGADLVFVPSDAVMYPGRDEGRYSTYVVEEVLGQSMEGRSRPTHFRGVTTIVAKLFHLVLPDVAVFGAKDWQQAAVVRRMVQDLNFPLRLVVAPTVRERDGLAMSSRNRYLVGAQRQKALVLSRALALARKTVGAAGARTVSAKSLRPRLEALFIGDPEVRLDYLAFFHPETLQPVERLAKGTQMALAAFVGSTRLIDNGAL